jgi:hypothetical protein
VFDRLIEGEGAGGGGTDSEEFENRQSEIFRYTLRLGECRKGGGSTEEGGERRGSWDGGGGGDGGGDGARSADHATDRSIRQRRLTTTESNASNHTGKNDLKQRRSGSVTETLMTLRDVSAGREREREREIEKERERERESARAIFREGGRE